MAIGVVWCPGAAGGGAVAEGRGRHDAAGREEAALQQPEGGAGAHRGGDGGLPHEAPKSRRPHGLLPVLVSHGPLDSPPLCSAAAAAVLLFSQSAQPAETIIMRRTTFEHNSASCPG